MTVYVLLGIGICCFILTAYCGLKYALVPTKFDYTHYEKWIIKYRRKHPEAEIDDANKQLRETLGAPIGFPLQETYLKRIVWGKRAIVIFGTLGSVLASIASVF